MSLETLREASSQSASAEEPSSFEVPRYTPSGIRVGGPIRSKCAVVGTLLSRLVLLQHHRRALTATRLAWSCVAPEARSFR